jgi:hypothetical protein
MQRILNDTTSRHTAKTYIDSLFPHQVLLTAERISGNLAHIALFYERLNIGWKNQHRRLLRPFHNRDYANPEHDILALVTTPVERLDGAHEYRGFLSWASPLLYRRRALHKTQI